MDNIRQKIGQLLLVGCQGESLSHEECFLIEEYQFGGVILFGRNCREPRQMVSLCHGIWESQDPTPPFIAIDQEGGRVHRLPAPFTHFPAAAAIGATNDAELAFRAGRACAEELALAGINLNFAPVLDVNSNPHNPIIGDRAFGSTAAQVIAMSSGWIDGLRAGGIMPCGKHFPGHGDTDRDSHRELPFVGKSLDALNAVELPPFAQACRDGIEALMTAHVVYPALDAKLPATLSATIVTGLLRHQLGYDGVVFSDDMEMNAISENYGVEEAALRAVQAGVDVLLFCHEVGKAIQAFECLCNEAERDPVMRARVEQSHRRITELKRRYLKIFTGGSENEIAAKLASPSHRRLISRIEAATSAARPVL